HTQHPITVKVVLFDMAIFERDRPIQHGPESKANAAFHLGSDDVGIDGRAAVDRTHDPIDRDMSGLVNSDLGHLRNEGLERFSNGDPAAFAFWHGAVTPARLL